MSKNQETAYERYLRGVELQKAGKTGDDIAKALGLKDAQAWYTTRHYYSSKKLAERTAPTAPNDPEPAAILEGVDCQRTAPRPSPMRSAEPLPEIPAHFRLPDAKENEQIGRAIMDGLQAGMRDTESEGPTAIKEMAKAVVGKSIEGLHRIGYITANQAKAALIPDGLVDKQPTPAPRRLAITQLISAEGEKVRYRLHDSMVFINSIGQKKCALRLTVAEMKVMIAELTDFLMEAGV